MTMRLDVLTNDAGELVRREHARDLGAGVIVAIYRLIKLVQLHDLSNQAFVRQLEQTHELIADYCLRAGGNLNVLFAERAIFVAGQLLKGSRGTYESARDLGAVLDACGSAEITIQRDVTREDLRSFAESFSNALRTGKQRAFRSPSPRIQLRPVNASARLRGLEVEKLDDELRIVRTYASAVVVMRRFFEDLADGRYILPRRIKRVAQSLVDLSGGATPAFLGVTEARNANHDEAGRAVNTAILAVAMAREVTDDRGILAQIAMAALMHDVARPRAVALARGSSAVLTNITARLTDHAEDRLAAGAAAVLTALGRLNEPTIRRTVVAFEALWLRRAKQVGPIYRGVRAPTLHARIIHVARRFNDLMTPEPGLAPTLPNVGIALLADELREPADRTVVRMLVAALGLLPVGSVVQLANGEVAEVVAAADPRATARATPRMRLVMDAEGNVYERSLELDVPAIGPRAVEKVVSIEGWRKALEPRREAAPASIPSSQRNAPPPPTADSWRVPTTSRVVPTENAPGPRTAPPAPVAAAPAAVAPPRVPSAPPIPQSPPPRPRVPSEPPEATAPGALIDEALRHPSPLPSEASSQLAAELTRDQFRAAMGTSPSLVADAFERSFTPAPRSPSEALPSEAAGPPERTVLHKPTFEARGSAAADASSRTAGTTDAAPPPPPPGATLEPSARGTLAQTPLLHMLVYMLDRSLTGTVIFFQSDGTEDVIYFERGTPMRVKTAQAIALLGDELIGSGVVSPDVVRMAASGAQRLGLLLGEYLVGYDFISRPDLDAALRAQISRKIATLANLSPDTSFAFFKEVNLLEAWGGGDFTPCDALSLVLACARTWHDRARMHATLGRIRTQPLVLHPNAVVGALSLTDDERAVLDQIRAGGATLHELVATREPDEEMVSTLVYTLAVTRQLDLPGQKAGPMAAPPEGEPSPRVSLFAARPTFTEAPRSVDVVVDSDVESEEEARRADRAIKAMTDFRLAETAVDRGDLRGAEEHAARAVAGDPGRPEYAAFHVWVRSMGGTLSVTDAVVSLTEIVTREPRCERALLYRGRLHKRGQRQRLALEDFEAILVLNPHHREAASEVRLLRNKKSVRP